VGYVNTIGRNTQEALRIAREKDASQKGSSEFLNIFTSENDTHFKQRKSQE